NEGVQLAGALGAVADGESSGRPRPADLLNGAEHGLGANDPATPGAWPGGPPADTAAPHAEARPAGPARETRHQEGRLLPAATERPNSLTSFIRHQGGATTCPEASRNHLLKKNFL